MNIKNLARKALKKVLPQALHQPLKRLFNRVFCRGMIFNESSWKLFGFIPVCKIQRSIDGMMFRMFVFGIEIFRYRKF